MTVYVIIIGIQGAALLLCLTRIVVLQGRLKTLIANLNNLIKALTTRRLALLEQDQGSEPVKKLLALAWEASQKVDLELLGESIANNNSDLETMIEQLQNTPRGTGLY